MFPLHTDVINVRVEARQEDFLMRPVNSSSYQITSPVNSDRYVVVLWFGNGTWWAVVKRGRRFVKCRNRITRRWNNPRKDLTFARG